MGRTIEIFKSNVSVGGRPCQNLDRDETQKKAFEWFHLKSEHLSLPLEELLDRLRVVFQRHKNKSALRKKFESRMWKKDESFYEYVHKKIIMGNRIPVDQDKLIEQIVEGIPDIALRDQARLQGFVMTEVLLRK